MSPYRPTNWVPSTPSCAWMLFLNQMFSAPVPVWWAVETYRWAGALDPQSPITRGPSVTDHARTVFPGVE